MKVGQLRAALLEWASLLAEDAEELEKRAIASFVEFLQQYEDKTAAAVASKIKALSIPADDGQNSQFVKISTLARQLTRLSRFCGHVKATAAAKDFDALATAILAHGEISIDAFLTAAKTGLSGRAKKTQRSRVPADSSLVNVYISELQSTTDENQFKRIADSLKRDSAINNDALFQIVNAVSGHVGSFSSKKAAHEELRVAFIEQARFRNKLGLTRGGSLAGPPLPPKQK